LRETVGITQKRLNAGDVTPTDTAQAEARLSRGLAELNAAEFNLAVSQATYTQIIGSPPSQLRPADNVDRYAPRSRDEATALAFKEHPAVMAAGFDVDVASTTIQVAERQPAALDYRTRQRQPQQRGRSHHQHAQDGSSLCHRTDDRTDL
jgi:outer membrane protein